MRLKKGDPIVFETRDDRYVYKVYSILPETSNTSGGAAGLTGT